MTLVIRAGLALLVWSVFALSACAGKHANKMDKNTNWLRGCTESAACGTGLQCVCGTCTSVCDRDEQCGGYATDAVCGVLSVSGNACAAAESALSVCTLRCENVEACAAYNDELACVSSTCARDPALARDMDAAVQESVPTLDATVPISMDATVPIPRDAGPRDVAKVPDTGVVDPLASVCGEGFKCQSVVEAPGKTYSLIADDDGHVYWQDWGTVDSLGNHRLNGSIKRIAKAGGDIEPVIEGLERPLKLWMDDDHFYWLSGNRNDVTQYIGLQTLYEAARDASALPDDAGTSGDPVALASRPFGGLIVEGEFAAWQQLAEEGGMAGLDVFAWPIHAGPSTQIARVGWVPGGTLLFGLEVMMPNESAAPYLDDSMNSILRFGAEEEELLADPPAMMATLDGDTIWLIHYDEGSQPWLASMSKDDGAITHLARASYVSERPKVGQSVVWYVACAGAGDKYRLWVIDKTGGEPKLAFTWSRDFASPFDDFKTAWTPDGDDAWVLADGKITHIARE